MSALYLAWAHLRFHAGRSALLVLVFALVGAMPLMTERLARLAEIQLLSRAAATPLVYGPPGSQLDLALGALFFEGQTEPRLTMQDYDMLAAMRLARPLPILQTHTARGFPIVATDIDYLHFRGLRLVSGERMARMGEAVVGAAVAARLDLAPGDTIRSDAEAVFEIAGAYPVRMRVTGMLAETGGPDDRAVFVDLTTGWIVAGHGHGHEDLSTTTDESVVLRRDGGQVIANAKLREFVDLAEADPDSFHSHGNAVDFPLTAIVLDPRDERSAAILRGRIEDAGDTRQIFRPIGVIRDLLDEVFRIKAILEMLTAAVALATAIALGIVVSLSIKLRSREFEIARRMGADRGAVIRLVAVELGLLILAASVLCGILLVALHYAGADLVRALILGW